MAHMSPLSPVPVLSRGLTAVALALVVAAHSCEVVLVSTVVAVAVSSGWTNAYIVALAALCLCCPWNR